MEFYREIDLNIEYFFEGSKNGYLIDSDGDIDFEEFNYIFGNDNEEIYVNDDDYGDGDD